MAARHGAQVYQRERDESPCRPRAVSLVFNIRKTLRGPRRGSVSSPLRAEIT